MTLPEYNYVVCVDYTSQAVTPAQVAQYLRDARHITSWVSPVPLVHFIRSTSSAAEISNGLRHIANGAPFFVAALDTRHTDGWLSGAYWTWLGQAAGVRPKTPTPSGLAGLLGPSSPKS